MCFFPPFLGEGIVCKHSRSNTSYPFLRLQYCCRIVKLLSFWINSLQVVRAHYCHHLHTQLCEDMCPLLPQSKESTRALQPGWPSLLWFGFPQSSKHLCYGSILQAEEWGLKCLFSFLVSFLKNAFGCSLQGWVELGVSQKTLPGT